MAGHFSAAPPGNQGDGIRLGESVGGQFDASLKHAMAWAPVSRVTLASGLQLVFPHLVERAKPGFIAVLPNGKRFTNEADSYHDFIAALLAATPEGEQPAAWLLADSRTLRRYGRGRIRIISAARRHTTARRGTPAVPLTLRLGNSAARLFMRYAFCPVRWAPSAV